MKELPDYPWDALAPFAERAAKHPGGIVDLSVGSPVDPTPPLVRTALCDTADAHGYPPATGGPALHEAIAGWFARRRGVAGLEPANILPTVGSKELVALLPLMLGLGPGDVVVHPRVAYPTYAIGAAMAGADACASDDPEEWPAQTRLVWLNSPANPNGRVLDATALRAATRRARSLGAVIVNDECYAELGWSGRWAHEPIPSILDPRVTEGDLAHVLAAYSLSKQSNMAGYRAAFVAGGAEHIARLTTVRKHAGLMIPAPVQAAMVAALGDDEHVRVQRERYGTRRDLLVPALERAGFRLSDSEAGLYLWASEGVDAWESVERLAGLGILVGPGYFYGGHSPRHVRVSLTARDERIAEAVTRLEAIR